MLNENTVFTDVQLAQKVIYSIQCYYYEFDKKMYSFTTENIGGYIDSFDFKRKSLLTVGSSGDQAINAILRGCKDITLLDINPFAKYYFDLKKAGILTLDYEEFMDYFVYYKFNVQLFNIETYQKLRHILSIIDPSSLLFWDVLYKNNSPRLMHRGLFWDGFEAYKSAKDLNLYLSHENLFNKTKGMIANVNPKFINCNILNADKVLIENTYDNIFLSNIFDYNNSENSYKFQLAINYLKTKLNNQGKMMLAYIYNVDINGLPKEFIDYDIETIKGVRNLGFNYEPEDAIITYQKTKK